MPTQTLSEVPEKIRLSLGTAIVLGLLDGKLDAKPTTAYLMTYGMGKCTANCAFCPQAKASKSSTDLLSRVSWPVFTSESVVVSLASAASQGKIKRVCIQALNYPEVFVHLETLVREIKKRSAVSISVSCQPRNNEDIKRLRSAGVDRLGIALDAATRKIFDDIKGRGVGANYRWDSQFSKLQEALKIFGKSSVSTHVIIGLGETEKEAVLILQRCVDMGVLPALFSFTPIRGTFLEAESPPKIGTYRRLQLARYLIVNNNVRAENIEFDGDGRISGYGLEKDLLEKVVDSGLPFRTSGCPDCNRPYYNEKPSGPIYNYPFQPSKEEIEKIKEQLS